MAVSIIIVTSGVVIGFNIVSDNNINLSKPNTRSSGDKPENETAASPPPKIEILMPAERDEVNENTKFIYEYYYLGDEKTDSTEEDAPYFLYGKTEPELIRLFTDWDIVSFEDNIVTMRKTVEGMSNQYYVIGSLDGYIAVFYKNEINGNNLKEITDTPVSLLPIEIQEQLLKGINVVGEDSLNRMLEDYES
jgi:hypothetical protein